MNIYQIPHTQSKRPQTFISVIDASGSMGSYWKAVAKNFNETVPKENAITITFDTEAKLCPDNTLSESIDRHGGGGTNITAAFELMDQKIAEINKKEMITVLFISDGQDNNLGTLETRLKKLKGNQGRTVTFICLGIQSQFPTFLSMYLRELYHNGLPSIPALYLIEYYSDAALFNKFETMKEHFTHKKQLSVKPAVSVFPWMSPMSQVYEGTWVLSSDETLQVDGKDYSIKTPRMELDNLLELFRGYVQELQMMSLTKNPGLKEFATKCIDTMHKLISQYKASEGIDLMEWVEDVHLLKVKLYERVKLHKLRHTQFRLKAYVENVETLAKGEGVKEMNEWDAAKKIGVGTITGSYQQKALNLKGFTLEMYTKMRESFIELFKATKLVPGSEQELSAVLKQTQKDVFLEDKFVEALGVCESQFDLVETMPVIGLAMKLKRYVKSIEDPWQTEVQGLSRTGQAVDSVHILQSKYKYFWKCPEGETMDFINCILPLCGPKEQDMVPLISHPLYNLLMTFVVSQTNDAYFEDAYLALLANALLYIMEQKEDAWKETMWARVMETVLAVYAKTAEFQKYSEALKKSPETAARWQPSGKTGCTDLAKPFVHLMVLNHQTAVSKEEIAAIMEQMYINFFGQLVDQNRYMENMKVMGETILDKVKEGIVKDFNKYITLGELKRDVEKRLESVAKDVTYCPVVVNVEKLTKLDQKITLKTLNLMYEKLLKKTPSDDDYLFWLYVSIKSRGKKPSECPRDIGETRKFFFSVFKDNLIKSNSSNVYADLREGFMRKFKEEHMYLMPMSVTKLKEYCEHNGQDISQYAYVKELNIIKNACMCPKCPFYLKPQERLMHHLSTWSEKCPKAFHKTVKNSLGESAATILDKVLTGEMSRDKPKQKLSLDEFNSTKEEALTYIKLLQDEYKKVKEEEEKYTEEIKALEKKIEKPAGVFHEKHKGHGGPAAAGRGRGRGKGRGRGGRGRSQKKR